MSENHPMLSEQQLVELYDELMNDGYSLEPQQLQSALLVLRHAAALGTPATRLSSLLVPIFAKSPAQRVDCQRRLERRGLASTVTRADEPAASPQETREGRRVWLFAVRGILILTAVMLLSIDPPQRGPNAILSPSPVPLRQMTYVSETSDVVVVSDAYQPLRIAMFLIPLLGFTIWLLLRWRWRKDLFATDRGETGFDLLDLGFRPFGIDLFTSPSLAQTAQQWRRHRRLGMWALDMRRTVETTIARGGLFTPVAATRPLSPLYLLLIEEESRHDHIARLVDSIADRLSREGVTVAIYYLHGSLRNLRTHGRHAEHFTDLAQIPAEPGSSVVVVGTGQSLLDPATSRIDRFAANELKRWPRRALLSISPVSQWGDGELVLLRNGFALGTARERGFAALGRHIANDFPDHHRLIEPIVVEMSA